MTTRMTPTSSPSPPPPPPPPPTPTTVLKEKRSEEQNESEFKRWPILLACFVCNLTTSSVGYHSGVLHVALLDTFHQDVVTTAWLGSLYSSLYALPGPLGSMIINMYDCRTCVIIAGILNLVGFTATYFINDFFYLFPALCVSGMGQGLALMASAVALTYNFPRHITLVQGISICGAGLGTFVHPPLLQVLINEYGMHGALLIVGAVAVHAVPCGLTLTPSRLERERRHQTPGSSQPSGLSKSFSSRFWSSLDVMADVRFLLFLLAGLGFSMGLSAYYIYLSDFLIHHGHDAITASFVTSATGAGSAVSRLLAGVAANDEKVDALTLFFASYALTAFTTFNVPLLASSAVAQLMLAVVFGLYTGSIWATYSPLLLQFLGVERIATGMGIYFFVMGASYLAGAPLAGVIYTAVENFDFIFYFSGFMFAGAAAAGMLCTLVKPRQRQSQEDQTHADISQNQDEHPTELLLLDPEDTRPRLQDANSIQNGSAEVLQTKTIPEEDGSDFSLLRGRTKPLDSVLSTINYCNGSPPADFRNWTITVDVISDENV